MVQIGERPAEDRRKTLIEATEKRKNLRRSEEKERWQQFGTWVRSRRQTLGRTQQVCADIAKIQKVQWSRIENAVFGVPVEKMAAIAEALEVEESEAYHRAKFKHPSDPPDFDPSVEYAETLPENASSSALATKEDMAALRAEIASLRETIVLLVERLG